MTKSLRLSQSMGLIFAMLLVMAAAPKVPLGPVALTARPGRDLEATARKVATTDLADGGPGALVLVGSQWLGTAGTGPALFVQVQSQRACGSAGCSTSIYLPTHSGWRKVLDAVSGTVVVQPEQHAGMHDLVVGKADRWVWNGHIYADTQPAPQVDLRPRHPPTKGRSRTHHPAQP
jgi:hypothetical protein